MGTSSEYNANTYIVQQKGGNIYLTGTANGNTKHRTYALQSPIRKQSDLLRPLLRRGLFHPVVQSEHRFLSENLKSYGRDFIGKVASGDYAGQPVYDGQALFPEYDAVCNLNHLETIRRLITGESAVYLDSSENLYGKGPDGKSYVTVYTRTNAPTETFNRNPEEGEYGAPKALKLYCGLLIGQHNVLGPGNALYDLKGEELLSGHEQSQTFELPDLAPRHLLCAPLLIAEDELQAQTTGKANPRLLLYAEDTRAYLTLEPILGRDRDDGLLLRGQLRCAGRPEYFRIRSSDSGYPFVLQ